MIGKMMCQMRVHVSGSLSGSLSVWCSSSMFGREREVVGNRGRDLGSPQLRVRFKLCPKVVHLSVNYPDGLIMQPVAGDPHGPGPISFCFVLV